MKCFQVTKHTFPFSITKCAQSIDCLSIQLNHLTFKYLFYWSSVGLHHYNCNILLLLINRFLPYHQSMNAFGEIFAIFGTCTNIFYANELIKRLYKSQCGFVWIHDSNKEFTYTSSKSVRSYCRRSYRHHQPPKYSQFSFGTQNPQEKSVTLWLLVPTWWFKEFMIKLSTISMDGLKLVLI